jgi:hypothetical protein
MARKGWLQGFENIYRVRCIKYESKSDNIKKRLNVIQNKGYYTEPKPEYFILLKDPIMQKPKWVKVFIH